MLHDDDLSNPGNVSLNFARPRPIIVASGGAKKGGGGEELEDGSRIRERYAIYDAA